MSFVPLVVRIHSRFVSNERPYGYLYSEHKGKKFDTCGSGWVSYVSKVKDNGKIVDKKWMYESHLEKGDMCKNRLTSKPNV